VTYLSRWKQKTKIEERKLTIKETKSRKDRSRQVKKKFERKSYLDKVHIVNPINMIR
jgi:hypothetical protein